MDTASVAILGLAQTAVGGLVGYAIKAARQIRDEASRKIDDLHEDLSARLVEIHDEVRATNGKVRELESTSAANNAAVKEWRTSSSEMRARCSGRFDAIDMDVRELRGIK